MEPVEVPKTIICRFCLKPMQIANDIIVGGIVTTRSFICYCRGEIFRSNWHRHKTELEAKGKS